MMITCVISLSLSRNSFAPGSGSILEIVCLDLEGVLVPEIWIAFAEETGIPELKRTTRDEPDYDKLMKYRLNILKEHNLGLQGFDSCVFGFFTAHLEVCDFAVVCYNE